MVEQNISYFLQVAGNDYVRLNYNYIMYVNIITTAAIHNLIAELQSNKYRLTNLILSLNHY